MQTIDMEVVYRLRDDSEQIARIQKATLSTEEFGIEPTHGLLGSDEWWANVERGTLETVTVRGTIRRVYMGSMGDWPEFEIVTQDGDRSSWTREANSAALAEGYAVGRRAEIDFVVQNHRRRSFDNGAETKVVLEIRVELAA